MLLIIHNNQYKTFDTALDAAGYLSSIGDTKWNTKLLEHNSNEFVLSDMDLPVKVLASKMEWLNK